MSDDCPQQPKTEITQELASRLLHLYEETPVERLAERLTAEDGEQWLAQSWQCAPMQGLELSLLNGPIDLKQLLQLKSDSKRHLRDNVSAEAEARGTLGYLLSQSAAVVHHKKPLSGITSDLREAFCELKSTMPSPWRSWLQAAIDGLDSP